MVPEEEAEPLPVDEEEEAPPEPHLPLQFGVTIGVELPQELSRGAA